MNNSKIRRLKTGRQATTIRPNKGQAMVEGAASLVIITIVMVGLIMLLINVYNVIAYKTRLELVATEAAKVYEGNAWFLGMRRQDFNANGAAQSAQNVADALCTELGLPSLTSPAEFEEKRTADGSSYVVCTVQASVGLPYINNFFPKFVGLTAKGVSTAGGMGVHPPAVVNFSARSTTTGRLIGCQLPAYALYTDKNRPLGNCSPPGPIKMPYSYTGYAMGNNTVPMLRDAQQGDAAVFTENSNPEPGQPNFNLTTQ